MVFGIYLVRTYIAAMVVEPERYREEQVFFIGFADITTHNTNYKTGGMMIIKLFSGHAKEENVIETGNYLWRFWSRSHFIDYFNKGTILLLS